MKEGRGKKEYEVGKSRDEGQGKGSEVNRSEQNFMKREDGKSDYEVEKRGDKLGNRTNEERKSEDEVG